MNKFFQLLIVSAIMLYANVTKAQGVLSSVVPTTASANSTIDMVIKGAGTSFNNTSSIIINGIVINPLNKLVKDPETIQLKFDVTGFASGNYPLVVNTNGVSTLPIMFKVFEIGNELNVLVNVMPLQSINVSDFDPNNLNNAPVLFTVSIVNDIAPRQNLRAVLTITGENAGKIATASKLSINLNPNNTFLFTNKEFTNYEVNTNNSSFFEKAIKTATLPADVYTYAIEIFNESGQSIGKGEGKNTIYNQLTKPELISPGNEMIRAAESLRNMQPLFQWFSQGNDFQFSLYEVNNGQKTAEEVVLNRPVFTQNNIKSSSFQYPVSAEKLQEGKTYVWQVKLNSAGSNGLQQLSSDVFWFKYSASGKQELVANEIKITPEDCYVQINTTKQFNANVFSVNNEPMKDQKVTWKVIPSDAGSIDINGLFSASGKIGSCAVVAKVGEVQEYATVNVSTMSGNDWTMKLMLQKLFGIPTEK